jgi:hypothetical protein
MRRSATAVLWASFLSLACTGAEWEKVEIESPYRVPKTLTISVVSPPALREPAQTLASALADELHVRGFTAVILPPASGAGEINLTLYRWDTQPKEFSLIRNNGAKGVITVVVDTSTIGVQGAVSGWVQGAGTVDGAASSVGHLIGRTVATGRQ